MIKPFAPRSKRPAAATEVSGSSAARSSTDPAPAVDPPLPPPSHPPPSAPAKSNTLPPTSKVKAPPGDTPPQSQAVDTPPIGASPAASPVQSGVPQQQPAPHPMFIRQNYPPLTVHPHLVHIQPGHQHPMHHPHQHPFLMQPSPHPCPPAHHMAVDFGLPPVTHPPSFTPQAPVYPIHPPVPPPPQLIPQQVIQQNLHAAPMPQHPRQSATGAAEFEGLDAVPVGPPRDINDGSPLPRRRASGSRRPPEPSAAPKHAVPPTKRARPSSSVAAPIADVADDDQQDDHRGHADVAQQVHHSCVSNLQPSTYNVCHYCLSCQVPRSMTRQGTNQMLSYFHATHRGYMAKEQRARVVREVQW